MSLFRHIRSVDACFARQADATSYRGLLREMQVADLYRGTSYAVLQKRAGRMWSALKRYRAEQRAVRTYAPTYMRRVAAEPVRHAAAETFPWPAAHAGCVMQ